MNWKNAITAVFFTTVFVGVLGMQSWHQLEHFEGHHHEITSAADSGNHLNFTKNQHCDLCDYLIPVVQKFEFYSFEFKTPDRILDNIFTEYEVQLTTTFLVFHKQLRAPPAIA